MKIMPDLSIVIVNYNTTVLTTACIQSIHTATLKQQFSSYEIIVVDNGSTDDQLDLATQSDPKFSEIKLIQNKNTGFGAANNKGVTHAQGRYLLFLNSDTLVRDIDFRSIITWLDDHPKVGAYTVRVNLENGAIDPACHRGFPTLWRSFCYFSGIEALTRNIPFLNKVFGGYHLTYRALTTSHEIDSPTGAFFMVPKKLFNEVGGFDESFFMYGEDLDLALRIKEKGYMVWYDPSQSIVHLKGQSGRKKNDDVLQKRTAYHFYNAMMIFYDKHYMKFHHGLITTVVHFILKKRRGELPS
jgi:GT2 family glycosyltransferase